MTNPKKISTIIANGNKIEYDVVLTFKSTKNNKHYCIYTDNTLDKNQKIRFYAACYDPNQVIPYIGEPQTQEEWTEITTILNKVIPQK